MKHYNGEECKPPRIITKGMHFVISEGEYSDYEVVSVLIAKKDIDIDATMQEYTANKNGIFGSNSAFILWLTETKKIAKELDYFEWHTATYGGTENNLYNIKKG